MNPRDLQVYREGGFRALLVDIYGPDLEANMEREIRFDQDPADWWQSLPYAGLLLTLGLRLWPRVLVELTLAEITETAVQYDSERVAQAMAQLRQKLHERPLPTAPFNEVAGLLVEDLGGAEKLVSLVEDSGDADFSVFDLSKATIKTQRWQPAAKLALLSLGSALSASDDREWLAAGVGTFNWATRSIAWRVQSVEGLPVKEAVERANVYLRETIRKNLEFPMLGMVVSSGKVGDA